MKYSCKKINPYDLKRDLLSLWKRNLHSFSENRFEWLYEQSAGIVVVHTWALFKKQQLCGSLSLLGPCCFDSPQLKGAIFIDFMIDRGERTLFPAMQLVRGVLAEAAGTNFDYLLALPNMAARSVFSRCGLRAISPVTRWVRILDFRTKMAQWISTKTGLKITAGSLEVCNRLLTAMIGLYSHLGGGAADIFSAFCNGGKSPFSGEAERFVAWRYTACPIKKYLIFTVRYGTDVVTIVYHVKENNIYIDKLLFSDICRVGTALNLFALAIAKNKMESIIISLAGHQIDSQLKRAFFFPRMGSGNLLGVQVSDDSHFVIGSRPLFDGDMDI